MVCKVGERTLLIAQLNIQLPLVVLPETGEGELALDFPLTITGIFRIGLYQDLLVVFRS